MAAETRKANRNDKSPEAVVARRRAARRRSNPVDDNVNALIIAQWNLEQEQQRTSRHVTRDGR